MAQTLVSQLYSALMALVCFSQLLSGYRVYWNIPSELCTTRYNISFDYAAKEFGITMNDKGKFRGNELTILYTPGKYPEIKGYKYDGSLKFVDQSNLEFINGGLPQLGDMVTHLNAFKTFMDDAVPDVKNSGLIVIDMEHFGATWVQNFNDMEIYRILSRKRVQDRHPSYSMAAVEAQAREEYESAAERFLVKTIQYGKTIRPYAKWGYYQYPQCFNGVGVNSCSNSTMQDNNLMLPLWQASDALFPSAYMARNGTAEGKAERTRGKVREARRAFTFAGKTGLIAPYITYKYYFERGFIQDEDLLSAIAVPKEEGAHGVVIWGSSNDFSSEEKCKTFSEYVNKSIGPIAKKYVSRQ